ncbi:MAG: hypothetical protein HGJ97_18295 [Desulfosporosinus sp.]|nr:hypothetical protein [Desulfosporosinus sp.]
METTLPHLGLLMLGAVLRNAGHRIRILDASAQSTGYEDTLKRGKEIQPRHHCAYRCNPFDYQDSKTGLNDSNSRSK